MKKLVLSLTLVLLTSHAFAQELKIKTVEIKTVENALGTDPTNPIDQIGQVIATAERIVALGESVYRLLQHGKPNNTSTYAPISVVPRDPLSKEVVSPLDLDECSYPLTKTYRTVITTASVEVVKFEYAVTFSHSCSYNGVGKYIAAAEIKPISVDIGYGWDVNATMKLSGIMNHGKKGSPVVGANLTMNYSISSWRNSFNKDHTVHITGDGKIDPKQL